MTITSVVLRIAILGTPEPPLDCDCAREDAGSAAAIRKAIMSFSGYPFDAIFYRSIYLQRVRVYSLQVKKSLLFDEALYEKAPRLDQHLLTLFRRQGHSDTRQHPSHAREQQLKFRQLFFSRLTGHKRQ
jgi:hypothetical protein